MSGNYWTRRRLSRRSMLRGAAVGAVGLGAAALIGCDSGDHEGAAGGKLVLHMDGEPRSLDPHFDTFTYNSWITNATHNNLLRFAPDLNSIVPDAAQGLPEQPDALTYVFKLKPGVTYQDIDPLNGRAMTSEDVKYSIERQTNQHGDEEGTYQHAYYFKDRLASIETPDPQTIVFTTNAPYAPFMNYIASPWTPIIARELVEANGDLTAVSAGSGPFILEEWQREVRFTLKKNPGYWKPGLPYVDELEYVVSPNPDTSAAQFIDGAFHVYTADPGQLDRVQSARGDDTTYTAAPSQFWNQFRMSPTEEQWPYSAYADSDDPTGALFSDIRVRKAIVTAIDKQIVLDRVYSGDGQITYGPILPQFTNWALTEELAPYDPVESAKLLDAANVGEIRGPMMWAATSPQADQIGEVIKQQLAQIGVTTDLQPMQMSAYFTKTYNYRYTFSHHVPLNSPEPDENLSSYFGERSTYFRHYNPDIFQLVSKQAETIDFQERQRLVKEAQEKIVLDYPIRFMFTTNLHQFVDNTVKGYEFPLDRYDGSGVEGARLDV